LKVTKRDKGDWGGGDFGKCKLRWLAGTQDDIDKLCNCTGQPPF